jgi:LemA protein
MRRSARGEGLDCPSKAALRFPPGRSAAGVLLSTDVVSGGMIMSYASSVLQRARIPVLVACLGLLLAGCGVNNIPSYQETAKAKWSDVLNQYQRRADLIPNLVETVKGYAAQERQVLEEVTNARARATQVQLPPDILNNPEAFKRFQEAQQQLSGALGRLLAVSERYPDLKSNQNFLALQSQLEGTENRIAVARRDYIDAVRQYNTELRTFPGVIWASTLYRSEKPMETFTVAEDVTRPPQVKF